MKYELNNSNNRNDAVVLNQSNVNSDIKMNRTAVQHAEARSREILNKKWKGKQCMGSILEV